jgi:flagellar biosynthesis/type III secretory pathway chaperone
LGPSERTGEELAMGDAFAVLTTVLKEQSAVLGRLLELARTENDALVSGDNDAFLGTVREQERTLSAMADLERRRAHGAAALADEVGLPAGTPLLALCGALVGEERAAGEALHEEMSRLAEELAHVNRENDALIRQALSYTQHTIALLTGLAQQDARGDMYAPPGHGRRKAGAVVLDRQA